MTSPPPPHFVTFSASLRPSSDIFPLPIDCTDLPAHTVTCVSASPTRVYMRSSSRRFSAYFVLSARSRVCVHRRVVTYSGHFLLRCSHGTFFCNVLNALRRLRPLTCVCVSMSLSPRVVTSSGNFHLRYCNTFLLTLLYSLQHPLLLMLSPSLL